MAYKNAYTAKDFENNVNNWRNSLAKGDLQVKSFKQSVINRLDEQIRRAKTIEKEVLSLFKDENGNIPTTEELTKRLRDYQKEVINFSGLNLQNIFIDSIKETSAKELNVFTNKVRRFIDDLLKSQGIEEYKKSVVSKVIGEVLNESLKAGAFAYGGGHKGGKKAETAERNEFRGFGDKEYDPRLFTKDVKQRFKDLMANTDPPLWVADSDAGYGAWIEEQSNSKDNIEYVISWNDLTAEGKGKKGLTKESFSKLKLDEDSKQKLLEEINRKVKEAILKQANMNPLIGEIIDSIINTEDGKYAFLVGDNEKAITGILGEISGIYYIHKLLGKTKLDPEITWRGGTQTGTSNQKPHQDILFKKFGIQIKNTTEQNAINKMGLDDYFIGSANYSVNFTGAGIDTVLKRLKGRPEFGNSKDIIEEFYGMYYFNVPIGIKESPQEARESNFAGKKALTYYKASSLEETYDPRDYFDVEGNEDYRGIYIGAREKLEEYTEKLNFYLYSISSVLMYMQTSKISPNDQNVLFIIGNTLVLSMVDILEKIKNDLKKQLEEENNNAPSAMNIELSQGEGYTIVDYMNGRYSRKKKGKITSQKRKSSYSEAVLSSIYLKSSFTF